MRISCRVLVVPAILILMNAASAETNLRLDRLIQQAKGGKIFYDAGGVEIGWAAAWTTRNFEAWGRVHAVRLLGREGTNAAPAVDALIDILRRGPNDFDTGDGIIPLRTEVARALGNIGDARAIPPLLEKLADPPEPATLTAGASVAPQSRTPNRRSLPAVAAALGMFGKRAECALATLETMRKSCEDEELKRALDESIARIRSGTAGPAE